MEDFFSKLSAPFPPASVSWRVGATNGDKTQGLALAYIDARDVMDRLDAVCGPAGWQNKYSHANGKTVCDIGIWIKGEWIWKADGAGDTDTEAEKGALSDAFKRCAVRWGIGRYLYDIKNSWVKLEAKGRSYVIAQNEYGKLEKLLGGSGPGPSYRDMREDNPPQPVTQSQADAHDKILDGFDKIEREGNVEDLRRWLESSQDEIEKLPESLKGSLRAKYTEVRTKLKNRM